jgi:hypothetical protein
MFELDLILKYAALEEHSARTLSLWIIARRPCNSLKSDDAEGLKSINASMIRTVLQTTDKCPGR